ncbi:hypothetical protein QJS66_03640 [Kocuria rhizophila]|nr:hypothetical protein QJS66_03640 [Kocuria rhizophila]
MPWQAERSIVRRPSGRQDHGKRELLLATAAKQSRRATWPGGTVVDTAGWQS